MRLEATPRSPFHPADNRRFTTRPMNRIAPPSRLLLALALLLCAGVPAEALQKKRAKGVPPIYRGTLNSALTEAEERNAVVVCVLLQANEEANDSWYENILRHPEFHKATADVLLLVANDDEHGKREVERVDADGKVTKEQVCRVYYTPDCSVHQGHSSPIFQRFKVGEGDSATLQTPFFATLRPSGKLHKRYNDEQDLGKIVGAIRAVRELVGPALTRKQVESLKDKLRAASGLLDRGDLAGSWKAYAEAAAITEAGILGKEVTEGIALVEASVTDATKAARAQLEAGEIAAGWRELKTLAASFADTPLEKSLEAELKDVRKDKRWREEIRDVEKEDEATALFEEIEELLKDEKERKALSRGKRLLSKYGGTRAAARFRSKYRDLVEKIEADD